MGKQHADKTIEKLRDYLLSDEGTVYLTDREEELLKMVRMANDLFNAHKFSSWQIAKMVSRAFDCSTETAQMVLRDAQILFGSTAIYSRNYMAGLHLDEVIHDMAVARENGDTETLLRLHVIKNRIIELLPLESAGKNTAPAVINYFIYKDQVSTPTMSTAKALEVAAKWIPPVVKEAEIVIDGD
jgi:hypothetical protein